MITRFSARRVAKAEIGHPIEHVSTGLMGRYQRITLYYADGCGTDEICIHFDAGAEPLPATEGSK